MGTAHLLCVEPRDDALKPAAGDVVVDATLHQRVPGAISGAELWAPRHTERTLGAYLSWFTAASRGGAPRALAYDDRLSMWWFLPLAIHNYYLLARLPLAMQRALWWLDKGATTETGAALAAADRVVIWSDSDELGGFTAEVLEKAGLTGRGETVVVDAGGEGWEKAPSDGATGRLRRMVRPQLGTARVAARVWRAGRARQEARRGEVDLLVATDMSDWHRVGEGPWRHRYLGDTARRLGELGVRVAWFPNVVRLSDVRALRDILDAQPEPTAWRASRPETRRRLAMPGRLAATWRRYLELRKELADGVGFAFEGVDLGRYVRAQADQVVPRLTAVAWRYERARAAVGSLLPRAVLVRNEFQASASPIVLAGTRQTPVFGYQHGNIPADHWLYRRSGALVRSPGEPAGVDTVPSPDMMLVYGAFERELMTRTGYPGAAIEAIGSLRHDPLFERARRTTAEARAATRRRLALPARTAKQLVVTVCAQLPELVPAWMALLIKGAREAGVAVHIAFRSHWNFPSVPEARAAVAEHGHEGGFSVEDGDLFDLLEASDVMVSGWSTTIVEAAMLGTPAMACVTGGKRVLTSYVVEGLAPEVDSIEVMAEKLRALGRPGFEQRWEAKRRAFLERFIVNADRPATERLAELVRGSG